MDLISEKVEHVSFGKGRILEVKEDKVYVSFQDQKETKAFQYPEAFEKFLKAENPAVEAEALEELRVKRARLEEERLAEEERKAKLKPEAPVKKTVARKKKA
ncbi:hypothetical protein ACPWSR_08270 [Alloiococcus sp. CFN-8]|uniref:hypothetical protein n=1 Tax=Alloiococcus sp. CFN-8 TaxID=3416081 RepID=UPI003CFA16E9